MKEEYLFPGRDIVDSDRIIYTPSDFARTSLFHLQETGTLQAKKAHTSFREGLSSYLFFMVEEGRGYLTYCGERYPLRKGDCVFVDCRHGYSHTTAERPWKLRWVHFYGPNMGAVYEKYLGRGGKPAFTTKQETAYRKWLEELYCIASSDSYVRDMKLNEKLAGLLVLLMEDGWQTENHNQSEKQLNLQTVKEYLDQHYTEKITLDMLSEKFYINKYYLLEMFKLRYGMGINEYVIHMRITKSKRLLRFTQLRIEEIAYECGMNSLNYFSRVFKKVEGVTPGEYRRSWVK